MLEKEMEAGDTVRVHEAGGTPWLGSISGVDASIAIVVDSNGNRHNVPRASVCKLTSHDYCQEKYTNKLPSAPPGSKAPEPPPAPDLSQATSLAEYNRLRYGPGRNDF